MSDQRQNGDYAFPHQKMNHGGWINGTHPGMSLRDYLAAHAPISMEDVYRIIADKARMDGVAISMDWRNFIKLLAKLRYEYADAMLELGRE